MFHSLLSVRHVFIPSANCLAVVGETVLTSVRGRHHQYCVESSRESYIHTMFPTFLAIVYIVYYLYDKFYAKQKTETKVGTRVCVVHPSVRFVPSTDNPTPGTSNDYEVPRDHWLSTLSDFDSDDDSTGEVDAGEEFFLWRRHGGGGWTGWNRFED